METLLADRVSRISAFQVMDLLAKAKQMEARGRDVIHLEVGEPDFPTHPRIIEAAQEALNNGLTKYTPATGLWPLRVAIAQFYAQRYGASINPERILITPGASGALGLATALLCNEGEGVLLADPGYPCNSNFLQLLHAQPQWVPTSAESYFQLNAEQVANCWQENTKAVMVASPSNPTGTVLPNEQMVALKQKVDELGGALIVDEIYQGLTYDASSTTVLALTHKQDNVLVINSFSKYFGMTGWRLGWLVAPEAWVPHLDRMAQNFYLAPSTLAQYAALAAFEPETLITLELQKMELMKRRDFLLTELTRLGFKIPVVPTGGFYLYVDVSEFSDDSFEFCEQLLEETGVAITPGVDFGCHDPGRYVRFAYVDTQSRLDESVHRIKAFLAARGKIIP